MLISSAVTLIDMRMYYVSTRRLFALRASEHRPIIVADIECGVVGRKSIGDGVRDETTIDVWGYT